MSKLIAVDIPIAPQGGFTGFGKLGLKDGSLATNADVTLGNFISSVIGVMTIVAILWFVFIFITGAIGYMTAGGDKGAIEAARKKILNGLVGLVIVIIAIFVLRLVGYLLGIPNILNIPFLFSEILGNTV